MSLPAAAPSSTPGGTNVSPSRCWMTVAFRGEVHDCLEFVAEDDPIGLCDAHKRELRCASSADSASTPST